MNSGFTTYPVTLSRRSFPMHRDSFALLCEHRSGLSRRDTRHILLEFTVPWFLVF